MIGPRLDRVALLEALRACEEPGAEDEEICAAVEVDSEADSETTEAAEAASEAAEAAERAERARLGEAFAACMRLDQRFELEAIEGGGSLVCFRLLGWFAVEGDALTAELRDTANLNGAGVTWLAPRRVKPASGGPYSLVLLLPLCAGVDDALVRWAEVLRAAEAVMMAHLGEIVCGGCDCLDTLAGKVLT